MNSELTRTCDHRSTRQKSAIDHHRNVAMVVNFPISGEEGVRIGWQRRRGRGALEAQAGVYQDPSDDAFKTSSKQGIGSE